MRNGIPEASDAEVLKRIYKKVDAHGRLIEPLTVHEQVLIFSLSKYLERICKTNDNL